MARGDLEKDAEQGSHWRDPAHYAYIEELLPAGCAWEFLRRNPDYQKAWRALRSKGNPAKESEAEAWGLTRFEPSEHDAREAQVFWTPAASPRVVPLISPPPELSNLSRATSPVSLEPTLAEHGAARLIQRQGAVFHLYLFRVRGDETPSVILPLDQVFEIRAAASVRLWRGLNGRPLGREPAELPIARRKRLALALRALDGRLQHASYRDIAEALFSRSRLPDRGWKTHDMRDRTRRLTQLGSALMKGGYRRLLLYPYRTRR